MVEVLFYCKLKQIEDLAVSMPCINKKAGIRLDLRCVMFEIIIIRNLVEQKSKGGKK